MAPNDDLHYCHDDDDSQLQNTSYCTEHILYFVLCTLYRYTDRLSVAGQVESPVFKLLEGLVHGCIVRDSLISSGW